ncbi:MAG TPA: hypothetical protein VF609_02800 [Flavisolibacter sp.]|jgi:xylan 1,4-beta-xylosidase
MQRRKFLKEGMLTAAGALFVPSLLKAEWFDANILGVVVNANAKGEKLAHYWSKCVGAGRANEALRATWLEQLQMAKKHCGFEYLRFHGLFHDDMFVYKEVEGKAVYNWQYIDDLFDRILAMGIRPFVELGFMPKALASGERTQFWWKGNVTPPKDHAKWGELVTAFTKHCIDRYGLQEVRKWYFEVWNEPNLRAFWDGSKSEYFRLYKTSVQAIKAVDEKLRVGGPATSNFVPDDRFDGEVEDKTRHRTHLVEDVNDLTWKGVWIKDFLTWCEKEQLPVDFVSTHPYPTDWALDPDTGKGAGRTRKVQATQEDLEWLKKTVAQSAYPHAEIHLTEWSSSPSPRDAGHDSLPAAAFIIKANLDCIGLAHSLSYWTFTDVFEEGGAGDEIFHGGFGLINYQGIVKPSFHAYSMLNQLGDEILQKEDGLVVTRHSKTKKITALAYHYPVELKNAISSEVDKELNTGTPKKFRLQLNGMQAKKAIQIETLDRNNGFACDAWKKMGCPHSPTREQEQALRKVSMATKKQTASADAKGSFSWETTLQPWTCVLIREV